MHYIGFLDNFNFQEAEMLFNISFKFGSDRL